MAKLHLWRSGAGGGFGKQKELMGNVDRSCTAGGGDVPTRNADRFHVCVGRTGELSWLQAGAVSP